MSLLYNAELGQVLERELLWFNHALEDADCMAVQTSMIDYVVVADVTEKVKLIEELHEQWVSLYNCWNQLKSELGYWIVILEYDLE